MRLKPKLLFLLFAFLAGLLNLASWLWMNFRIPSGSYPFILYYNIYFVRDLLGPRFLLFQVPLLGFVIFLVNFYLAWLLFERSRPYAWLILGSTLVIEAVVLYASFVLTYVNT